MREGCGACGRTRLGRGQGGHTQVEMTTPHMPSLNFLNRRLREIQRKRSGTTATHAHTIAVAVRLVVRLFSLVWFDSVYHGYTLYRFIHVIPPSFGRFLQLLAARATAAAACCFPRLGLGLAGRRSPGPVPLLRWCRALLLIRRSPCPNPSLSLSLGLGLVLYFLLTAASCSCCCCCRLCLLLPLPLLRPLGGLVLLSQRQREKRKRYTHVSTITTRPRSHPPTSINYTHTRPRTSLSSRLKPSISSCSALGRRRR